MLADELSGFDGFTDIEFNPDTTLYVAPLEHYGGHGQTKRDAYDL